MDDLAELRQRIEAAKTEPDPNARDSALAGLELEVSNLGDGQEAIDLLGQVRTYRSDARLQLEGAAHG
jgi:hypothetical protein